MKRKIFILIFLISTCVFAQDREVYLNSNLNIESNSLNTGLINEIFSGYINNDLKNQILENNNRHLFNISFVNSLKYREKIKNNLFYNFSFSDISQINAKFDNDLLKIILNGNYQYQNQTLEFDKTRIRANRYQQFKLFIENKKNKFSYGFGLSYLHGNHNLTIISNIASIYTAPMGEYLNLDYDINSYITDTSDFSLFENNGNGISFDLTTSLSIFNHNFDLYIYDLGFINWSENSQNIYIDSSYIFNGISIDNVFEFNDSILELSNIVDDYDNINDNTRSFKSYLSSNIGIKVSKKVKGNRFGYITYGLNTKWHPYLDNKKLSFKKIRQGFEQSDYKPYYYIKTEIKTNKFSIFPKIGYGGYTNNFNLDLALLIERKISFAFGTQHLESLFSKENSYGIGAYLQIYKAF
tara:strand:- start:1733 stop:2965 length:1233 start_codon:yes stop_codon:yes gene_type:complete